MSWKPAAAALTLRKQVDRRWPKRDRGADGIIGDKAHQARPSDHNPNSRGFVDAIDIDADLLGKGKGRAVAQKLAEIPAGARVLCFCYDTGERYLSIADLFTA